MRPAGSAAPSPLTWQVRTLNCAPGQQGYSPSGFQANLGKILPSERGFRLVRPVSVTDDSRVNEPRNYGGLDVVRFAAALFVTLYHLGYRSWQDSDPVGFTSLLAPIAPVMRWGWVGVPIFFVLSGFVIAMSASARSASAFVRGRFLRLYPAAWICAPITFVCIPAAARNWGALVKTLALWPLGPWVSGVYWTLGLEIVFYALVAGFVALRWSIRSLGVGLGLASSAYWLARFGDHAIGNPFKPWFAFFETQAGYLTLLPHGCYFGLGVVLYATTSGGRGPAAVLLGLTFTCAGTLSVLANAQSQLTPAGGATWLIAWPAMAWLVGLGAVVWSIWGQETIAAVIGHRTNVARTLGLLTYPLYLVHAELGMLGMLAFSFLKGWAIVPGVAVVIAAAELILVLEGGIRRVLLVPWAPRTRDSAAADLP